MIRHEYIGTSFMHQVELKLDLEELVQKRLGTKLLVKEK